MEPHDNIQSEKWHLPFSKRIMGVIHSFSLSEKITFYFLVTIFFITSLALLWQVNKAFLVEVPDYGGALTEGVVGSPRFVNPLLAISDIDRDLTSLVYSGLVRVESDGTIIPDLAQSYTISEDGLTYTFVLKNNAVFQDNTKVTADDVVFTIEKAQNSSIKSPRKISWDGVKVEKIDDRTVQFTLKQAYSPFIQNTTIGILPKHIWSKASDDEFPFSQFNTKPIGSGPYQIDSITYSSSGLPEEYHLIAFKKFTLERPYISKIVIKSYADQSSLIGAYKNKDIESMYGISPEEVAKLNLKTDMIDVSPLSRVFGVFFNQNVAPVFVYKEVRQALNMTVDRTEIINSILGGYGQPINEPVPPRTITSENNENIQSSVSDQTIANAETLLVKAGWKKNASGIYEKKDKNKTVTLTFSISTSDAPELKAVAEILQKQWQKIGAQVAVKIFEISDLNQNIIRPRKYDALLFGEIVSRDLDLYPFWHSSGRNDPGLNIAMYTNLTTDKILENLRKTTDINAQQTLYESFNKELSTDIPAVFIYTPYFIYIVPEKIHNITLGQLTTPSERFSNVYEWYIETNKVWKIFTNKK